MPGISLIICCYNSAKTIQDTLQHVFGQKTDDDQAWEVLLINNNSTDETVPLAQQMAASNPKIDFKVVDEPQAGHSYARETGVRSAKHPIISFVDDDNLIPENWVSYMNTKFKDKNIGVIGCTTVGKFDVKAPEWYTNGDHQFAFAIGRLYSGAPFIDITENALLFGAGLTLRKEVFEKLWQKNWAPLLKGRKRKIQTGGDDSEITLAARMLGYRLFFSDEVKIIHWIIGNRLSLERLKEMTKGFGVADVFLLPYNYYYLSQNGQLSFVFRLRKYWWFNYIGKYLVYLKSTAQFHLSREKLKHEINCIRSRAFCQAVWQERRKFKLAFKQIQEIANS